MKLVIVDIQPEYESNTTFDIGDMLRKAAEDYSQILVLFNGEDTLGMISEGELKDFYFEKLDYDEDVFDELLSKSVFFDKGYGFFRDVMDSDVCFNRDSIVKIVKYMIDKDIRDIRELEEEDIDAIGVDELLFDDLEDYGFWVPDLADELPNWSGSDLAGGARNECMAEVEILGAAQGLNFNHVDDFIYEGENRYTEIMGESTLLREYIYELLNNKTVNSTLIDECIIVAGELNNQNILAKNRDRNYFTRIEIVRELLDDDTEIVYFKDLDTNYSEGMNSHGIGVINSALSIAADEKAKDKTKSKILSDDGPRMLKALECSAIEDAIRTLVGFAGGIKGHTFIGAPNEMYSIEMSTKHAPVITKLKTKKGFSIRTNHGIKHKDAGYSQDRRPEDFISSKVRKAQAEAELTNIDVFDDVAPALTKQNFSYNSNKNMLRRTEKQKGMKTTSQVAMNLPEKEFVFYYFPNQCEFNGIIDKTPDSYRPKIKIKTIKILEKKKK